MNNNNNLSSGNPPVLSLFPGDLVTEQEAAAILAVSPQTLRNWRWQHQGPHIYKIGARLIRYERADLVSFVTRDDTATKATRTRSSPASITQSDGRTMARGDSASDRLYQALSQL